MLGKSMLREQRVPVGEDFRLARVVGTPIGIELAREAVPVAADVRATTLEGEVSAGEGYGREMEE